MTIFTKINIKNEPVMKRNNSLFYILAMATIITFTACGGNGNANENNKTEEKTDVKTCEVDDKTAPEAVQNIFTVLYAVSDDNFVNVRTEPNSKAQIVGQIDMMMYGLGNGILLDGKNGDWVQVKVGEKRGWANSKFLGEIKWYTGTGENVLVASAPVTTIYGEDYTGEGDMPVFTTLEAGTVIADDFQDNGEYYVLSTAHDCLYILKSEAKVQNR